MRKKDLEEKLGQILESRTQSMLEARRKGDHSLELMWFGNACGIIDSMRAAEIFTWDQAREMREQLMKKRQDA